MFFVKIFGEKLQIWASEHHFGELGSDARPSLMARWKAHVRLSIRVNWTSIFAIYHGSGVMRWNVYSSAVFTGVDLFALNFYLDRVVPHQPFLASEIRRHWATRWYMLHPSASPHFDIIPECDRQTPAGGGGGARARLPAWPPAGPDGINTAVARRTS